MVPSPPSTSYEPVQRPATPKLDESIDDFEGLDSDEIMEKDKTEIELEKLVFGDESGFHERLKSYKDTFTDSRDLVDGDRQQVQDGLEVGNLEDLDDADVCKVELPVGLALAQHPSSCSSSTLPRPFQISPKLYPNHNQTKTQHYQTTATLLHGLIATTNVSSFP